MEVGQRDWVQRLPAGPLDIIGDVHGELEALESLLARLGVCGVTHTRGRHLVFVGDLVDRGPDSPGVVRRVRELVEAGCASIVVGNHEVNLLAGSEKEGNGWWFGHSDGAHVKTPSGVKKLPFPSVPVAESEREALAAWLGALPVALERDDIRVVHACWHGPTVDALRGRSGNVGDALHQYDTEVHRKLEATGVLALATAERSAFSRLRDPDDAPTRVLGAVAEMTEAEQNDNPIRRLTSGEEVAVPLARYTYLGGQHRVTERRRWWESYNDDVAVVVGHFWRSRNATINEHSPVWRGVPPFAALGRRRNVFCVDYSVGRRYRRRWMDAGEMTASSQDDGLCLAALQWPERVLVFDDTDDPVPVT